jgi:CRISPR-associated protein Cst1
LYEDLFRLPEAASRVIRGHLLRLARRLVTEPAAADLQGLRLWHVTRILLEEVVGMEPRRIEAIRQLGDRIAAAIAEGDRRLFSRLRLVGSYRDARSLLLRAGTRYLQERGELLLSFDDFLLVFEEGEELPRVDWRLAWDLVFLRVLDQLHARGWFAQHAEALAEVAQVEDAEAESQAAPEREADAAARLPA